MRIRTRIEAADRARIPLRGPVVVVANNPHGVLDGAILSTLLTQVRPDVKVLTHFLFSDIPELQRSCIFVDPFQTDRSLDANRKALREAVAWIQRGGMLAMFPAGEAPHWQMPVAQIADPGWNNTAARLIRRTGALALPVYFCGHNNFGFQVLGMIHPKLRSAFLLQEFLQQAGKAVEVRVGSTLSADAFLSMNDDREATEYLRWRTHLLARRNRDGEIAGPSHRAPSFPRRFRNRSLTPYPRKRSRTKLKRCLPATGWLRAVIFPSTLQRRLKSRTHCWKWDVCGN